MGLTVVSINLTGVSHDLAGALLGSEPWGLAVSPGCERGRRGPAESSPVSHLVITRASVVTPLPGSRWGFAGVCFAWVWGRTVSGRHLGLTGASGVSPGSQLGLTGATQGSHLVSLVGRSYWVWGLTGVSRGFTGCLTWVSPGSHRGVGSITWTGVSPSIGVGHTGVWDRCLTGSRLGLAWVSPGPRASHKGRGWVSPGPRKGLIKSRGGRSHKVWGLTGVSPGSHGVSRGSHRVSLGSHRGLSGVSPGSQRGLAGVRPR